MNEIAVVPHEGPDSTPAPGHTFIEPAMPSRRFDTNRSTIAGRRPDDFVFEPRDSTFYFRDKLVLSSRPIQIAYDRTFQRCQLALFETEMIAPIVARNDDGVRAVNAALDTKIRRFAEYMDGEMNRINKMLADNGKSLDRGEYTSPVELEVKVYTPRARRYMEMLQLADDAITTYARAWLEGFMDEINFKRSVFAVRMRTIYLAREIWELHTRSYISLRKARQAAEAERARLIEARHAARQAAAEGRAEGATDSPDASDEHIQRLTATVEQAGRIISEVEGRGGMEAQTPDFGTSELASDSPQLLADAERAKAKAASRPSRAKGSKASDDDSSGHDELATGSASATA
ncbi:hypothetical protein [Rhodanobacter denitrificans]|uniref:DUF1845 domain-containing protein n=1 Tax=Rhodanobacter denitrificans TaxID=666685 RepID=M4NEA1_9GAMM|nr:hypothetical protein [Rhodanobacter denitrificans]AGG89125.1 hypothetical protein R2APBS1_2002 [Rhodanobacter denitrificans]UJJ52948.1 hypothetical protein LRK52_18770 [Rhodanobacter denitrificans]